MVADSVDELIKELASLRIRRESIRTRETQVFARLVQAAREAELENDRVAAVLQVGDRVRITNTVNRPNNLPPRNGDQVGTITNITRTRFYITTDSGIETWRAARNIARLG